MIGDNLPNEDHVVRYVKPTSIRTNGKVDGSVFCLRSHRPDDTGLSINWLECFEDLSKAGQLAEVRRLARLEMRKRGCLAELNVGETKQHVRKELDTINFYHMPLKADGKFEADPSHSEILGLPPGNSDQAALIGDMIAECIKNTHPAIN